MASHAYTDWLYSAVNHLKPLATECDRAFAHDPQMAIGEELLHAYIVATAGYFQAYLRDVYDEAAGLIAATAPPAVQPVLALQFDAGRKLSNGNATWGNIVSDLKRLDIDCKMRLGGTPERDRRKTELERLNNARNYAAHKLKTPPEGKDIVPADVHGWLAVCEDVVLDVDAAVGERLSLLLGQRVW